MDYMEEELPGSPDAGSSVPGSLGDSTLGSQQHGIPCSFLGGTPGSLENSTYECLEDSAFGSLGNSIHGSLTTDSTPVSLGDSSHEDFTPVSLGSVSSSGMSSNSDISTLKAPPGSLPSSRGDKEVIVESKKHSVELNVETPAELGDFLKEIHKDFLDKVVPSETRLMDIMLAKGCLTISDNNSLNGKHVHTSTDQARKMWLIFNKMSVEDFKSVVFPELCRDFPHIIPTRFCEPKPEGGSRVADREISNCLRHNIKFRVHTSTMADMLFDCECVSLQMYSEITSDLSKLSDTEVWGHLFQAFSSQSTATTARLKEKVEGILHFYQLNVPQDLTEQIKKGVPCTCYLHRCDLPPGAPPIQIEMETGETDLSSSPCTSTVDRRVANPFQIPGSYYLGSDDPEFKLAELDADFKNWAKNEGLSEGTLQMLLREDLTSKDDLKLLKVDSIERYLPRFQVLPAKQKLKLENLIKTLSMEADQLTHIPGLGEFLSDVSEIVRLLLVGKTGSGKSSSCNTILGSDKFTTSLSMGSFTREYQFECTDDEKVQVFDCPGLFDTSLSIEAVCTVIVRAVLAMHPGPTAILYTLKIGDHYTDEEFGTYQRLKALFGEEVCRYMTILFTRGDELKREGKTISEYIQNAPERFKQVLRECGGRYVVFDNTDAGKNAQQIEELKEKVCEIMTRDNASHFKMQHFSTHKDEIEAEVHRRLQSFKTSGTFGVKKNLISEGEEGPGKGSIFWQIWEKICEILKNLLSFLSGAAGHSCG